MANLFFKVPRHEFFDEGGSVALHRENFSIRGPLSTLLTGKPECNQGIAGKVNEARRCTEMLKFGKELQISEVPPVFLVVPQKPRFFYHLLIDVEERLRMPVSLWQTAIGRRF